MTRRCYELEGVKRFSARAADYAWPRQAGVVLLRGRAEQLPLRTSCVDLLTSFNACLWFQPGPFLAEARRVLVQDGRLALIWNDWDERDAFTAAFVRLMRAQAGDYPPEDRAAEVAPLYETRHFHDIQGRTFPLRHRLDLPSLLARMRSMSYVPRQGPAWEQLASELRALFERHVDNGGLVTHHYTTRVFVATPTAA